MAKGINIGIASDTRDFERGVKSGIVAPLEDAEDQLKTLERAGERSGDSLEAGFREQSKATDNLRRDYKDLNREIQEGSSRSGRAVGENVSHGAREASEGLDEVKESARSNATEVAASFDGSAQSIADGFQGAAAEAFAGFGPAGVLAGLAAAAGIGLISQALGKGKEDSEEFKAEITDLADDLISTGARGSAGLSKIVSVLQGLATGGDSAGNTLSSLRKIAKDTGISYKDLAQAYAGNHDGLGRLINQQGRYLESLKRQRIEQNDVTGGINRAPSAITRQIGAQEKLIKTLEQQAKKQREATKEQNDYIASGAEALDRQAQAAQSYADSVQGAYQEAGSAVADYVEDGVFNLDKYTKHSKEQADAVTRYQQNMVVLSSSLSAQALAYVESLGPEAAPLIDAFVKAPLAQKKATADVWNQLGSTSGSAYNSSLQGQLNSAPARKTVDVDYRVDDSALRRAIASQQGVSIGVNLVANGTGKRIY